MIGEVERLRSYSTPSSAAKLMDSSVVLPPTARLGDAQLDDAVDQLVARHRDGLLALGRTLLTDRAGLFRSGAAPRSAAGSA